MDMTFNFAEESKQLENFQTGENWTFGDIGGFDEIKNYVMENKDLNLKSPAKLFLHKALGLTGAEISFNTIPAGTAAPFKHKHKENEEIMIVLSGEGIFSIDGKELNVKEGSIIRVAPDAVRAVSTKNSGLTYICIQVKANSLEHYTLTDAEML